MNPPTIAFVGSDPFQYETMRAALARSPYDLRACRTPPNDGEADLVVMPAERLDSSVALAAPVIAWGPAGLLRAAFLHGCVDYLREPWTAEELLVRADAALSRRPSRFEFPWGTVRWDGDALHTPRGPVALTRRQSVILHALLRRRGQPVPREALAALLGAGAARGSRRVDVHISAIRRRIRAAEPRAGAFITCVRRQGYMIA